MHKILLDLEGGDEVKGVPMLERAVLGAVAAIKNTGGTFICLGNQKKAQRILEEKVTEDFDCDKLIFMDVTVGSEPDENYRAQLVSTIAAKASELLKTGDAEGFYTCGNTQHVLPALILNRVPKFKGIRKPYLLAQMPARMGTRRKYLLCDVGATQKHDLRTYEHIARITEVYARLLFNEESPRIGILSNGVEDTKGDDVMREAREKLGIEFVEPQHLYAGQVHGSIVSGVIGNLVLKASETTFKSAIHDLCELYLPKCTSEEKAKFMQTLEVLNKWWNPDEQGVAFFGGFVPVIGKGHGTSNSDKYANGAANVYHLVEAGASEEISKLLEE
ncbi:hypothetical protein KY310_02140 [Candidatus Woesearchaeota archaeon]|nr:hypothetical protein [Candidatus Woesearchaeota archaeon]